MRPPLVIRSVMVSLALLLVGVPAAVAVDDLTPDGAVLEATADGSGFVAVPREITLAFPLAPGDRVAGVWVSDKKDRRASGSPTGASVSTCGASDVRTGAGRGMCTVPTRLMRVGTTYWWWAEIERTDALSGVRTRVLVGPARFAMDVPAGAVERRTRRVTFAMAARLPSRGTFGGASIHATRLVETVRATTRGTFPPRRLAVACWSQAEFTDLVASKGLSATGVKFHLSGLWRPAQPRWLHISGDVCRDIQSLLDTRTVTLGRAYAVVVVLHEAMHAHGIANEAQANCLAVQLVERAGRSLGLSPAKARALATSARVETFLTAPKQYWDSGRCHDGGAWDLASPGALTPA